MTAVQIPTPEVLFTKLLCYLAEWHQDEGGDPDAYPDLTTVGGKVKLTINTPDNLLIVRLGTSPARLTRLKAQEFIIQPETGELADANGASGVFVPRSDSPGLSPTNWTITAEIQFAGMSSWKKVTFYPKELSEFNLIDLVSVSPSPGEGDLAARVAVLEAGTITPPTGGGGGPTQPYLVRNARYGASAGYGWALHQVGFHVNAVVTGSHNSGSTTSAAAMDAAAGYLWEFVVFNVGAVITVDFELPTAGARSWVGWTLGGSNAALPYSGAYDSSAAVALRASPPDGDTTFKVYSNGVLTDTGVPIIAGPHRAVFRKAANEQWSVSVDGSTPIEVSGSMNNFAVTTYSKDGTAKIVKLKELTIADPVGATV